MYCHIRTTSPQCQHRNASEGPELIRCAFQRYELPAASMAATLQSTRQCRRLYQNVVPLPLVIRSQAHCEPEIRADQSPIARQEGQTVFPVQPQIAVRRILERHPPEGNVYVLQQIRRGSFQYDMAHTHESARGWQPLAPRMHRRRY